MPGIGEALHEARRAMGLELGEVQEHTKIRIRYLRALEEEDWEALPGQAYARGFLRTYAEYLGLDSQALLDEYRRRALAAERPEPRFELPAADRGARRPGLGSTLGLAAAALLVLLLVLGITGGSEEGGDVGDDTAAETGREPAAERPPRGSGAVTREPSKVSITVKPLGSVWVCLVDDRGRELIEGETLVEGDSRGPFRADSFEVTFGNGEVEMRVNDENAKIPAVANPLGYEVAAERVAELAEPQRPTCT